VSSGIVVLKFGGTSLGSPGRVGRAAARVHAHLRRGRRPVVVVSATGGVTDRIVRLLAAVSPGGRPDGREADRALATGEDLSAALLAAALRGRGVSARSLRGGEAGVWAPGAFCGARIEDVDPRPILALVDSGTVPVISGFQGARDDGETVTLGRGGSDTSAVAIAAALGPAPCHIITDVPAVFDRDPTVHADARRIGEIDPLALVVLAESGARVVHAEAARLALAHGVTLRVYAHWAPLSGRGGTVVRAARALSEAA
jgi:aspartate kinase